ncbi:MAG: pyruvate kinase, partial [Longimicrobiales bacterium]
MRTKIVATIGPATADQDKVHALAELGVDVVRLNFAHGTHEEHSRVIQFVREASAAVGKPMAVLADLGGPKIRIGSLPAPLHLHEQNTVVLSPEEIAFGDEIPTTYPGLADDLQPGNRVLLD